MSLFVVDVESDGPIIGKHSMICFGAVRVDDKLENTFYGKTKPISDSYIPESLAVSGFTREQHLLFNNPQKVMTEFDEWIRRNNIKGKPILISDNNGYDASWINFYFWDQINRNPFGWSSRRIGDLFCGFYNDMFYQWKKHRKTNHDHNPVNDAIGNAEALLYLQSQGFNLKF